MIALCIESSHARGMGHLYRAMNLADELKRRGRRCLFLLNDDKEANAVLDSRGWPRRAVPLAGAGWQGQVAGLAAWIDDRLDTSAEHARAVKDLGLPRATFDDKGDGAALADLNVAALSFGEAPVPGRRVLRGPSYLVLDPRIPSLRRVRSEPRRIVVSMGGSDTYGATLKAAAWLKAEGLSATIVMGPSFRHRAELEKLSGGFFTLKQGVPSLPEEFALHDLAITGGGVTAFEAAAAGLPAVIVANEPWEEPAARWLEAAGAALYAGPQDRPAFRLPRDLAAMSRAGMKAVPGDGAARVCSEVEALLG